MAKTWIILAGILGAAGVGIGAFGAHSLPALLAGWELDEGEIAKRLDTFEKGARYQMYHALALLAVGILALNKSTPALTTAGTCYVLGIAIFSGLLYAIVLTGIKPLGAVVPLGGMALIVGWIAMAVAGFQLTAGK